MTYIGMTLDTGNVFSTVHAQDRIREFLVARLARAFGHVVVVALDLNVIRELSSSEC